MALRDTFTARVKIETILKEVHRQKLPLAVFRDCIETSKFVRKKVDWVRLVIIYGNKEAFFFMYEKCVKERLDDFIGVFQTTTQSEGRLEKGLKNLGL